MDILPKLRFLQFPWRWLVVVEAPLGIFFAAAIWNVQRWWRVVAIAVSSAIFISIMFVTLFIFHQDCDSEDSVTGMLAAYRSGQGFQGTDEYALPGRTTADGRRTARCVPQHSANIVLAKADDGNTPEWDPANGPLRCNLLMAAALRSYSRRNTSASTQKLRTQATSSCTCGD